MSKVILDTDILSEYLKGYDQIVSRRAANYARQHGAFTFTSVTVHEIVFGLAFKGAAVQLAKARVRLNLNEQITPTATDYLEAAIIKATARKQGSIQLPHTNEGAHDQDVPLNGAGASENRGEHRNPLLRERIWGGAAQALLGRYHRL